MQDQVNVIYTKPQRTCQTGVSADLAVNQRYDIRHEHGCTFPAGTVFEVIDTTYTSSPRPLVMSCKVIKIPEVALVIEIKRGTKYTIKEVD